MTTPAHFISQALGLAAQAFFSFSARPSLVRTQSGAWAHNPTPLLIRRGLFMRLNAVYPEFFEGLSLNGVHE